MMTAKILKSARLEVLEDLAWDVGEFSIVNCTTRTPTCLAR